uniref:S-layer homology domain-containing protein n=1 Tax=Acetivibrio cellulolyticus TaxID=35830 RepID=UPI0001E305A5|nr:S-layer homology domain-containing protein [Acetivibrio cellulolyticus]
MSKIYGHKIWAKSGQTDRAATIKGLLVLCTVMSIILTCMCSVYAAPRGKEDKEKCEVEQLKHHKVPKALGQKDIKFIDLRDTHWAYIAISDLYDRGIIIGYSDNSFRPNEQVTRSQFAAMLVKTLGLDTESKTQTFKDVPKKAWDFKAVEAAKSYLTGYKKADGELYFYGNRNAVREDMAVALVKALELTVVSDDGKLEEIYDDYESISENLRDFVYTAYKEGIMFGADGKFNPQGSLTRAEAAALLEKVIEKTEKVVIGDTSDEDKVVLDEDSDVTLSVLKYDGKNVEEFDEDYTYYVVELEDEDDIPTVTAKATDSDATVTITQATDIPGTAKVVVTAKDGETTRVYKIRFLVEDASTDVTLKELKYDNKNVEGFDKDDTYYIVELENDDDIPTVTATATDADATVIITQGDAIPGYAKIIVVAEDGVTRNVYYIKFTVKSSSDATIKGLKYDNKSVANFDAATKYYTVELENDDDIPTVTAVANDSKATLNVVQATYLPGTAKVYVKAEDGTSNIYKIHFVVKD